MKNLLGAILICLVAAVSTSRVMAEEPTLLQTAGQLFFKHKPNCPPAPPADPKQQPEMKKDGEQPDNRPDQFAGAGEAGTQPGAQFNPNMFGDLIGLMGQQLITVPGAFTVVPRQVNQTTTTVTPTQIFDPFSETSITVNIVTSTTTTVTVNDLVPSTQVVTIPIAGRYSGFKVSDNDSPRPMDRIYFNYNQFNDVSRSVLPPTVPSITMSQQLLGFERTFLGGDASFGLRLPFLQVNGFDQAETHIIGDLSVRLKFAWINDPQTRDVLSSGLIVTAPTGGGNNVFLVDGSRAPHSTLIQPWGGFIYNLPRLYFQGFASLVAPTDSRDPTVLFNSIAAGWWMYRGQGDSVITAIIPVVELHINTPLNHRSPDDLIRFQDQFNLTSGVYFAFPRMTIGAAVGVPLAGPRPYNVEGIVSINYNF